MEQREKSCCFTGHRDLPAEWTERIHTNIKDMIDKLHAEGVTTYYAGGAQGFDALASEVVIERRTELPDLRLVVVAPHDGHTARWSAEERMRYARIAEQANEVVTLAPHYFRGCMQIRNRYMVDRAAVCVCYLTETTGGTVNTVNYARKRGLIIYNLAEGADTKWGGTKRE